MCNSSVLAQGWCCAARGDGCVEACRDDVHDADADVAADAWRVGCPLRSSFDIDCILVGALFAKGNSMYTCAKTESNRCRRRVWGPGGRKRIDIKDEPTCSHLLALRP
jgi:hypothetical protein